MLALASLVIAVGCSREQHPKAASTVRPDLIVFMTDDQTAASIAFMPKTKRLIADAGVSFENSITSYPLCCPSRATYLTGQYAHNHGVYSNAPPLGGYARLDHPETTLPAALRRGGYTTVHVGKYLNGYGIRDPAEVPPGWDEWYGTVDPSTYSYVGTTINENGRLRQLTDAPADYLTDALAGRATGVITRHAHDSKPLFLNLAFLAPHGEVSESAVNDDSGGFKIAAPRPAPRHVGTFANEPLPQPPSFNEADVSDKPPYMQVVPLMPPEMIAEVTRNYRAELETLQAVDDAVEAVIGALRRAGRLDRAVIVFTSDNGFLHGEHRKPFGKYLPYEPSLRVPLIIRGGGAVQGQRSPALVANIDLAPTLLQLAHARPLRRVDGVSLVPLLRDPKRAWNRPVLLEGQGKNTIGQPIYRGIRTDRFAYIEYQRGREFYDLRADPDELTNLDGRPALANVEARLATLLRRLETCAGPSCARPDQQ